MNTVIKAHLNRADSTVEVRRIPLAVSGQDTSGILKEIASKVGSVFPGLADKQFTLKWKDSDGDLIMMTTDEEVMEAVSHAQNSPLKIFITVDGVKDTGAQEFMDIQSDRSQEPAEGDESTNEHEADFMRRPFCRPPPPGFAERPPFEHPMEFFGKICGSRKRGYPDYFNPRRHSGPHFGHLGPRGHHFMHLGPQGHHFGPQGPFGMLGAFGGHGFFEGPHSQHFPGEGKHFRHYFGHHHHFGKRHEKHGWKANLRESVPVAHRRWAKAVIRSWRVQNLKNATSTSSDSDQDIFAIDASIVPDAYSKWLESVLPKWHKCQGEKTAEANNDKDKKMEDKNSLKASVPVEFRKWTKWYLARHFGKKEAPKFRKHGGCQRKMEEKMAKHKKAWKKGCKQHTLSTSIPMMHRMWVKIFINDWRQEHNIPDPKLTSHVTVSSESEDTEKVKGDITVPNDYVRWLRKYLARWHLWRGEIEKVEIEKGGMAEFKDTIPKGLCKWVKYYLWQRYGNGTTKEADTACQYQKWLQAFQRKWLREQVKGGSADDLILTSSEDEAPNRPINVDEAETTVESLKKLRLEGDEDGTKKVRFNPSTEGRDSDKTAPRNIGDFESALFHANMNPGFRHWAKEALGQWDGKTPQSDEANTSELIPPHIYNWMSKVMMKTQMKKMKQELKQAKQSMKADKKAHK